MVAVTRCAAEGRAQRAADHDRRRRLWRAGDLRRSHPDPGPGSHRQERAALYQFPLLVSLLADSGGDHHRTQSSFGGLWGSRRNSDRVSRLQLDHPHREGPRSAPSWRTTGMRPRGSARTTTRRLREQPSWALRPVADRHGLRVLLRLRRRRCRPVAAEPVRDATPIFPFRAIPART